MRQEECASAMPGHWLLNGRCSWQLVLLGLIGQCSGCSLPGVVMMAGTGATPHHTTITILLSRRKGGYVGKVECYRSATALYQTPTHRVTYQQKCNVRTSPMRGTVAGCHGLALTRLREHEWVQTLSLCTPQWFLSAESVFFARKPRILSQALDLYANRMSRNQSI